MELSTFKTSLWITAIVLAIASIDLLAFSQFIATELFEIDPIFLKITGVICALLAVDYALTASRASLGPGMMKLAAIATAAIALFDAGVLFLLANRFSSAGMLIMVADIAIFAALAAYQFRALSAEKVADRFASV